MSLPNDIAVLIDKANDKVLTAIEFDEAGDLDGAMACIEQAMAAIAIVPDGKIEDSEVSWDRAALAAVLDNFRRRSGRKTGVVCQLVRPTRG